MWRSLCGGEHVYRVGIASVHRTYIANERPSVEIGELVLEADADSGGGLVAVVHVLGVVDGERGFGALVLSHLASYAGLALAYGAGCAGVSDKAVVAQIAWAIYVAMVVQTD